MAVYVKLTAEAGKGLGDHPGSYTDGADTQYAYASTEGGVVRVLVSAAKENENVWRVAKEYGPAAWLEVTGKRYTEDSGTLSSFIGEASSTPRVSRGMKQGSY